MADYLTYSSIWQQKVLTFNYVTCPSAPVPDCDQLSKRGDRRNIVAVQMNLRTVRGLDTTYDERDKKKNSCVVMSYMIVIRRAAPGGFRRFGEA